MSQAEKGDTRKCAAPRSVAEGARGVAISARRLADLFDCYASTLAGETGGASKRELYLEAMDVLHALKVSVRALSDRIAEAHAGRPDEPEDCG